MSRLGAALLSGNWFCFSVCDHASGQGRLETTSQHSWFCLAGGETVKAIIIKQTWWLKSHAEMNIILLQQIQRMQNLLLIWLRPITNLDKIRGKRQQISLTSSLDLWTSLFALNIIFLTESRITSDRLRHVLGMHRLTYAARVALYKLLRCFGMLHWIMHTEPWSEYTLQRPPFLGSTLSQSLSQTHRYMRHINNTIWREHTQREMANGHTLNWRATYVNSFPWLHHGLPSVSMLNPPYVALQRSKLCQYRHSAHTHTHTHTTHTHTHTHTRHTCAQTHTHTHAYAHIHSRNISHYDPSLNTTWS